MKTLILYLTHDGQTQKIAEYIAQQLNTTSSVQLGSLLDYHAGQIKWDLDSFDRIIIGASIRYGHFHPALLKFIQKHTPLLNQKKSAFFSVNLTARKANRNTPETNIYTRKLLTKITWQPTWCAVFAGALRYPRYTWYDRTIIQFIMKITGGETDLQTEIEYTDWETVNNWVKTIVEGDTSHTG